MNIVLQRSWRNNTSLYESVKKKYQRFTMISVRDINSLVTPSVNIVTSGKKTLKTATFSNQ